MPSYLAGLFERYRAKGILVDTNLMVLVAVGTYNRLRIKTFKRTIQYTLEDLELMLRMLAYFGRRLITPNILTEVDNLTRQLPEGEHKALATAFAQLISRKFEVYVQSSQVAQHAAYVKLGLTDCATAIAAAEEGVLIITDDLRLSNILSSLGMDAININHIRTLNW